MGTDKRNRQKERRRQQQASVRAELKRQQRRRATWWGVGAAVVLGGGLLLVSGLTGGGDDETATTTTTAPTDATVAGEASPVSDAACPPAGGTDKRVTTFDGSPKMCIDPAKQYTATFSTTMGDFTAKLDAKAAPTTVNNFVVLARNHFYDGTAFHRVSPGFVIQGGDPEITDDLTGLGTGGPGYTIAEEPPADGKYGKYDLAMAKTQAPNSTGSQFFVVTGDPAPLDASPTYSLFGEVTDGRDVVDAIAKLKVDGETPRKTVRIETLTIDEQ